MSDRLVRLHAALTAQERRSGRVLATAGAVLVPLGVALILLGWYGAAGTAAVFEQVPYLISGGMLGLGCMVLGGLCYFAWWLERLVAEVRRQGEQHVAAVDRVRAEIALQRKDACVAREPA